MEVWRPVKQTKASSASTFSKPKIITIWECEKFEEQDFIGDGKLIADSIKHNASKSKSRKRMRKRK